MIDLRNETKNIIWQATYRSKPKNLYTSSKGPAGTPFFRLLVSITNILFKLFNSFNKKYASHGLNKLKCTFFLVSKNEASWDKFVVNMLILSILLHQKNLLMDLQYQSLKYPSHLFIKGKKANRNFKNWSLHKPAHHPNQ